MSTPTPTWNLGTVALNGRDGDTIRDAGIKYNAHRHFSTDIENAIQGAAAPTASNPFATMADVGSGGGGGPVVLTMPLELTEGARAYLTHDPVPMEQSYRVLMKVLKKIEGSEEGERFAWNLGAPVNCMAEGTNLIASNGTYRFDRPQGEGVRPRVRILLEEGISMSLTSITGDGSTKITLDVGLFDGTYPVVSITADNGSGSLNYASNGYPAGYWFQWISQESHPILPDGEFARGPVIQNHYMSNTGCRVKFSFDGGTTWKYWNGTSWIVTDLSQAKWDAESCKFADTSLSNDYSSPLYGCRDILGSDGSTIPLAAWNSQRTSSPIRTALGVYPPDLNSHQWVGPISWLFVDPDKWMEEGSNSYQAARVSETRIRFDCPYNLNGVSEAMAQVIIFPAQE